MMRKIFGGTMVLSIVGAVILGGVLAFVSSHMTPENHFTVGDANWSIVYEQEPTSIIGPNGTSGWKVGEGGVVNDVSSTLNISTDEATSSVHFDDSSVSGCSLGSFAGHVNVVNTDPVPPGVGLSDDELENVIEQGYQSGNIPAGLFDVTIDNNSSSNTCYGATIGYHVIIGVTVSPASEPQGTNTAVPPVAPPPPYTPGV